MRAVRPELKKTIKTWLASLLKEKSDLSVLSQGVRWRWSPLFETEPVGGPSKQPVFTNAVLVVDGPTMQKICPSEPAALQLLEKLMTIEKQFGRNRQKPQILWGPRSLDLDLLAWGDLNVQHENLILPHPRLIERSFVIVPLAAALTTNEQSPRRLNLDFNWL